MHISSIHGNIEGSHKSNQVIILGVENNRINTHSIWVNYHHIHLFTLSWDTLTSKKNLLIFPIKLDLQKSTSTPFGAAKQKLHADGRSYLVHDSHS